VHPGPTALTHDLGFYSSHEFDIKGLDAIADQTFEMGRSCVSPDSRNGTVVALLWAGVSEIVGRSRLRYLTGCVSLEEMEPAAGWELYDYFVEQGKISDKLFGTPLPHVKMERPSPEVMEAFRQQHPVPRTLIPPLFKGYLRMGAKICSEPVFDADFGTIDFLILLDTGRLPERYQKHFNVVSAE
jgi:putative hemolysin